MAFIRKNTSIILLGLLFFLGLIFRLWAAHLNWMHYDENYYLNITQNYSTRGELTFYMWRLGNLPIISGGGSGYGILALIYWLKAVNYSLFWGRVLNIILNLITAGVMYWVTSRWWSSRLAGLAAFGYSIVSISSFNTMIIKMDAIAILGYSLVLLLFVYSHGKDRFWLHLLVGVAAVATAELHVLGVITVFAISMCYLFDFIQDSIQERKLVFKRSFLGYMLGALFAGLVYLAVHVFPDPRAYFVISQNCFECNESILVTESKRLIRLMAIRPIEVLINAGIIFFAFRRKRENDRRYLVLILGWLLGQALFGTPPYDHYFNHFWPITAIGVGGWVAFGSDYIFRQRRVAVAVVVAFVLLTATMVMYLNGNYQAMLSSSLSPGTEIQYIRNNFDRDTVVMGNVPNYYYLRDYPNYLTYRDGTVYGTILRNEDLLTFWRRIQPQVIFVDAQLASEDSELQQYILEGKFRQIMPDLWVR